MIKYILLFTIIILSSGCTKRYYHNIDIIEAVRRIQKHAPMEEHSSVTLDAKTFKVIESNKTFRIPQYNSWPYIIGAPMKTRRGYYCSVTKDVSGLYFKKRYLHIWVRKGFVYVRTPYKEVEVFIYKQLNNK
ncbi:MAG: hypothetical protein COA79_17480 [Planctomycetota bacterium]|nr:MAG: hypothetical protein COA79_17480 [Planctomycetota bacterium]